MQDYDKLQSQTIAVLRLPLIVGVVFIHAYMEEVVINGVNVIDSVNAPLYNTIAFFISRILANVAVPMFYFISGFLFFYRTDYFDRNMYVSKLKKRAKTLLLPYILWNLATIFLYVGVDFLFPSLLSGLNKPILDYTIMDWIAAFWDTSYTNPAIKGSFPKVVPFWFIRDLMVTMLLSPVFYWCVRRLNVWCIIGLGVCWFFEWDFPWTGFSMMAFFFFSSGAYFSIHRLNFVQTFDPFYPKCIFIYLLLVICRLFNREIPYISGIDILVGIVVAITLTAHFAGLGKWETSRYLSSSSFFLYAFHNDFLAFVRKVMYKWFVPSSDLCLLCIYFLSVFITVFVSLLLYSILKKVMPRFTAIITGSR